MKPSEKPIDRLDQFFKNKLDEHTIAPSENAWAKVEAGLSKKNEVWFVRTRTMVRLAAAVLIMGALVTVFYWSQRNTLSDQPALTQKKIEKAEPNTTLANQSKTAGQKIESTVVANNTITSAKKTSIKNTTQPAIITSEQIQKKESVAIVKPIEKSIENTNLENSIEEKIKQEATPKATVASGQQKPIKLEFTLDDLTSVEPVATTSEVKSTGLKKVLELAREMKEGEGPLTNLKEKKNELFARNFIKGKERTQ